MSGTPPKIKVSALNDLLIGHLASKLLDSERQHVLAWACRLRERNRYASLKLLVDTLLEAVISARPVAMPFAAPPAPSDQELPTLQELTASREPPSDPKPRCDMGWARELVRAAQVQPNPSIFLGMQPKPPTGTMCYMSVFGS